MTPAEYLARRNQYSYPAVGLDGCLGDYMHRAFESFTSMENHVRGLLRSPIDADSVLGYLSVIYWGYYSGQDGVIRRARALGRVELAKNGADRKRNRRLERILGVQDIGVVAVAVRIRQGIALTDAGNCGAALKVFSSLPQVNFAFASKLCAFVRSEHCGVIDSVIAAAYPMFGFRLDAAGYIRKNNANASYYSRYCAYLFEQAQALNRAGEAFKWQDLDGTPSRWRAVDVERALY